jgi:hypothetical protein
MSQEIVSMYLSSGQVTSLRWSVFVPLAQWYVAGGSQLFTNLELQKSTLSSAGPWGPVLGMAPQPARLPLQESYPAPDVLPGPTRVMAGTYLRVEISGLHTVEVVFTLPGPLTVQTIASLIAAEAPALLTAYAGQGKVFLQTTGWGGPHRTLKILDCTAAARLGFEIGDSSWGADIAPMLLAGVERYTLVDTHADADAWYRWRLVHVLTGAVSEWSIPVQPSSLNLPIVSPSNLVHCTGRFVDEMGRVCKGRKVHLHSNQDGRTQTVEGSALLASSLRTLETDDLGCISVDLIRGTSWKLTLDNHPYLYSFRVPTDLTVSQINLFDPAYAVDTSTAFASREPTPVYADRRQL